MNIIEIQISPREIIKTGGADYPKLQAKVDADRKLSKAEFMAYAAMIANDYFESAYIEECESYSDQIGSFADFIKENCR